MPILIWIALGLFAWPAAGAEEGASPGINDHYVDADYAEWVEVFERPGREVFDRRFQIVQAVAPKPGMVIADIGAGSGLFTRLFARAVRPGGTVIAVDISSNFVEAVLRSAGKQALDNVQGVVNSQKEAGLGRGRVDLAFLCDTYHHFEYPAAMLASIREGLKPGGELLIVDFIRQVGLSSPWVLSHVRLSEEEVIEEVEAAGFKLQERRPDLLRSNYFLRFRKTAAG